MAADSGVLVKWIVSEKDRPLGNVIWGVSRSLLETNRAYFAPYRSKNHDAIPAEYRDSEDLWIGNNLHLMVILQNTKLLPAERVGNIKAFRGTASFIDRRELATAART